MNRAQALTVTLPFPLRPTALPGLASLSSPLLPPVSSHPTHQAWTVATRHFHSVTAHLDVDHSQQSHSWGEDREPEILLPNGTLKTIRPFTIKYVPLFHSFFPEWRCCYRCFALVTSVGGILSSINWHPLCIYYLYEPTFWR